MLTKRLAQEIVDRTIEIIGYNVNVMDQTGMIIGSGDPKRLYEIHSGAIEAIAQQREIEIDEQDVKNMKGTRTGINLPIMFHEEIVGVIGVTGPLEQIRGYGKLVKMAAELSLNQAFLTVELQWDKRFKEELLRQLLDDRVENQNTFLKRAKSVGLLLPLPCEVWYIEAKKVRTRAEEERMQQELLAVLGRTNEFIRMEQGIHIILLDQTEKKQQIYEDIHQTAKQYDIVISVGESAKTLVDIPRSYEQAYLTSLMSRYQPVEQRVRFSRDYLLDVMLYKLSDTEEAKTLRNVFAPIRSFEKYEELIETLNAYIEHKGEIQKIADELFIHRNTVQYRLHKMKELTGKDPRDFRQLFELYASMKLHQFQQESQLDK